MADRTLAAAAGTIVASIEPAWAVANSLYTSTDGGRSWTPLPVPPDINSSLYAPALSADGLSLAGTDAQHLFAQHRVKPTGPFSTWVSHPVQNLFALAFDPTNPNELVAIADGPQGRTVFLYLSDDGGRTLSVVSQFPLPLGYGQALVVLHGTAIVAVAQTADRTRVFAVPLAGGTAAELPQPAGGIPYALAAEPRGTLYLITQRGLFVLGPGAVAWRERALPPGLVDTKNFYLAVAGPRLYLAVNDTDEHGTLWTAHTAGGDWRSVLRVGPGYVGQPVPDGARVWVPTANGPVVVGPDGNAELRTTGILAPVIGVASAAWRPTRVAVASISALFFSDDGGRTWDKRTPPVSNIASFPEIAWSPDGRCIAVVAGDTTGAHASGFLSDDQGRTWWRVPDHGGRAILPLIEAPVGSGLWWSPGLYRSAPGRPEWTRVSLPPQIEGPEAVRRFESLTQLTPARDGVWLGGFFGIWHVQPSLAGDRFRHVWGAGWSYINVVSNPYDPSVVYSGLRRSVDGGRTWSRTLPGPAGVHGGAWWMAFAPDHPGAVLGFRGNLVRDDGRSWIPFWSSPGRQWIDQMAPAGPRRFYVVAQNLGLVFVEDRVTQWHAPVPSPYLGRWTSPPREPGPAWVLERAVEATAPSDPRTIYRLTVNGKLDLSRDGGRNFSTLAAVALADGQSCCWPGPGPLILASALTVSPTNPNRLYVGLTRDGATSYPPDLGFWMSDDGGRSWTRSGLGQNLAIDSIAAVPGSSGNLYAVVNSQLWRSPDGGGSWTPVKIPPEAVYSVATPTAAEVLVGGNAEIWQSEDGGRTFSPRPLRVAGWGMSEHPESEEAPVTAILQTRAGTLYVGSNQGLARSRDGGRTWQVVSEPVGDPPVLPSG